MAKKEDIIVGHIYKYTRKNSSVYVRVMSQPMFIQYNLETKYRTYVVFPDPGEHIYVSESDVNLLEIDEITYFLNNTIDTMNESISISMLHGLIKSMLSLDENPEKGERTEEFKDMLRNYGSQSVHSYCEECCVYDPGTNPRIYGENLSHRKKGGRKWRLKDYG